jgi:hypothetical protein
VEKLVYLLMGPGGIAASARTPALSSDSVRQQLVVDLRKRDAGAIQINVSDSFLGHPFGVAPDDDVPHLAACVSLWVDSVQAVADDIAKSLAGADTGTWHGYLVTESEPIVNRTHPPGSDGRLPGFAQIVALTKPDQLSWGEWRRIWQGSHTSVAINTQSTFRYVQNVIFRAVTPSAPAYAAIVEECFPLEAARNLNVFFDAVGDDAKLKRHMDAMSTSCDRFMDGSAPVTWTTEWQYPVAAA